MCTVGSEKLKSIINEQGDFASVRYYIFDYNCQRIEISLVKVFSFFFSGSITTLVINEMNNRN